MLINGLEINRENLSDWSCHALRNIQGTLCWTGLGRRYRRKNIDEAN